MARNKAVRLRAIAELIRSRPIANQEELAQRLASAGHSVAQATVSRDLEELGAVKVRHSDGVAYALPGETGPPRLAERRLAEILREWVRAIAPAASLVVVKTHPGSAHLVAAALDQAEPEGAIGTVSGDDTLFVATASPRAASALARVLAGLQAS